MPSGYTKKRRIGSILTNASSQVSQFIQNGDEFVWVTAVGDVNVTNLGTTATLYTLTVSTGVKVKARLRGFAVQTSGFQLLINSPDEASVGTNAPVGNISVVAETQEFNSLGLLSIGTNLIGQIRAVSNVASTSLSLATIGWADTRGRFA